MNICGSNALPWAKANENGGNVIFLTHKSGNLPFLVCVKCDMMSFVVYLNLSRRSPFISCHEIIIRVKKLQQIWFVKSLTPLL